MKQIQFNHCHRVALSYNSQYEKCCLLEFVQVGFYRISSCTVHRTQYCSAMYRLKMVFISKHRQHRQHHASEIVQCLLHHTVVLLSPYLSQSASHWLAFRNTRFSKCLSVSFVLLRA